MNPLPAPLPPSSDGANELFVFGNGDMGQHGLGTDAIDEIKRPRLHVWVAEKNRSETLGKGGIESIAAGGMHTLAIDSTGRVSVAQ
jgi:regulator of chromosome condensation